MAQPGAPYRVVDGTLLLPWGDNGLVVRVKRGTARRTPKTMRDVSGPANGADPIFSEGNYVYAATVVGSATEGREAVSSVAYTHATKTLSKSGAFANVAVGEYIYVASGTNATAGLYEIATNADDDTVTLVTAPGTGDQSDFSINGLTTLAGVDSGQTTLQMGNGETWSGTAIVSIPNISFSTDSPDRVPVVVSLTFTGAVTVTTGLV